VYFGATSGYLQNQLCIIGYFGLATYSSFYSQLIFFALVIPPQVVVLPQKYHVTIPSFFFFKLFHCHDMSMLSPLGLNIWAQESAEPLVNDIDG